MTTELDNTIENLKKQLRKMSKQDLFNLVMYIDRREIVVAIEDIFDEKNPPVVGKESIL